MALKPSVILNPGHRIHCLSFCFGEQIVHCWESQIGWWLERRLTVKDWLSEHLVLDWLFTNRWIEKVSQILLCFIVFAHFGNDLWITTFLLWSWLSLVFSLVFCFVKLLQHIYIKSNKQNKAQSQANKIISQALLFSATLNSLHINLAYTHRTEKPSKKSRHHPRESVCLVSAARESCSRMRLCSRSWILLAWSNRIYSAIQKSLATPHFFCFQGTRLSYIF